MCIVGRVCRRSVVGGRNGLEPSRLCWLGTVPFDIEILVSTLCHAILLVKTCARARSA